MIKEGQIGSQKEMSREEKEKWQRGGRCGVLGRRKDYRKN